MSEALSRIEAWLAANHPELLETLGPPATDAGFAALEATIGRSLPEAFKRVYRIHNGQSNPDAGLIEAREWLSLEAIAEQYGVWKGLLDDGEFDDSESDSPPGVQTAWWSPGWIPITHNGGGDHQCLDLDPAPGGEVGQIIDFYHDDPTRTVPASDLETCLSAYADALESGQIVYSDAYGGLIDRADAEPDES